jgi:hypothetical protein
VPFVVAVPLPVLLFVIPQGSAALDGLAPGSVCNKGTPKNKISKFAKFPSVEKRHSANRTRHAFHHNLSTN